MHPETVLFIGSLATPIALFAVGVALIFTGVSDAWAVHSTLRVRRHTQ